jgi:hypothetical protein
MEPNSFRQSASLAAGIVHRALGTSQLTDFADGLRREHTSTWVTSGWYAVLEQLLQIHFSDESAATLSQNAVTTHQSNRIDPERSWRRIAPRKD